MPRKTLLALFLAVLVIFLLVFACIALRVPGKIIAWGSVLIITFVVNRAFNQVHHP